MDVQELITQLSLITSFVGGLLRPFGALAIGIAAGWLATIPFIDVEKKWQLQIAALLGLLGAFVTLNIFSGAGSVGMFALGAGICSIVLLYRVNRKPSDKEKGKD